MMPSAAAAVASFRIEGRDRRAAAFRSLQVRGVVAAECVTSREGQGPRIVLVVVGDERQDAEAVHVMLRRIRIDAPPPLGDDQDVTYLVDAEVVRR
jgi:hypothetical protein